MFHISRWKNPTLSALAQQMTTTRRLPFVTTLHGTDITLVGLDRSYLPIAGDNAQALATVAHILDTIGYGVVDYGPLAESWRQQPDEPVYGAPYGPFDNELGHPAGEETIRTALAAARR